MYVLKLDNKYIKTKSYNGYYLVDNPFKASLFTRKVDAFSRADKYTNSPVYKFKDGDIQVILIEVEKYKETVASK